MKASLTILGYALLLAAACASGSGGGGTRTAAGETVYSDWETFFRHEAPNVEVVDGSCPRIRSRGDIALDTEQPPPIIEIDERRHDNPCLPPWLDPSQVESVRVEGLSGAAAYGSEGAAGIIKIKTKPQ